jgi:2-polyprenyl-3-methyl-5-hydroxy-6-metoxy-1,4-benzoquinol methylase
MTDSVYLKEKQKYTRLWSSVPEYREASAADFLAPAFLSYFSREISPGQRIIDFGCGAGRSAIPFLSKELQVDLVDFADPCLDAEIFLLTVAKKIHFWEGCLWDLPPDLPSADWIICFDVLEHLPERKIRATLRRMAQKMRKGGMFSIDLRKDRFGAEVGNDLHLTLKPKEWWHKQVSSHFLILEELTGGDGCLVYPLRPKYTANH